MKTIENIIQQMNSKPYLKKKNSIELAKLLNVSYEDVIKARHLNKSKAFKCNKIPKILIFDLETAPMQAYVWGRWKQYISLDQTVSEWFIICWSAKWLYSTEVFGDVLTSEEAVNEDDSRIVKSLWKLINEADIVVAHNGNKADIPWMNTRFILNNLNPPKPYFSIDTCLVARKQFNFSSNKLDALATYFGLSNKIDTNFKLWKNCLKGDKEALSYMLEYNKMDVKILEEIYLKLRPWIKNHPNISNITSSRHSCPYCGREELKEIPGKSYFTSVNEYKLYRCNHCKGVSRGKTSIKRNRVNYINSLK